MARANAARTQGWGGAPEYRGAGHPSEGPDAPCFFDRTGRRIGRDAWQRLSTESSYIQVARDVRGRRSGEIEIVTFWLGLARPVSENAPPAAFRSIVDGLAGSGRCLMWTWESEQSAVTGHAELLRWVDETGGDPSTLPGEPSRTGRQGTA